LFLVSLGAFEVERVVHRDGNLAGYALHELELGVRDALRHQAAEAHGAQAALRRRQGNDREGADVIFAETLQEFGKARFFLDITDDEGLLRLPDPAGRIVFNGSFRARGLFAGDACFKDVEAHEVADGIMQDEREESNSMTECSRAARSWNSAGRSRCWAMASLTSSKASS